MSKLFRDQRGITMIELLVVLLIIAVLSTIAMAAFFGVRDGAEDRRAMAVLRSARVALETHVQDHGTYDATVADLISLEPSLKTAIDLQVTGTGDSYVVSAVSPAGSKGGGRFTVTKDPDGHVTRTCEYPGHGGCLPAPDAQGNRW